MQQLTPEEIDWIFAMYPMANTYIYDDPKDPEGFEPVADYLQGLDFIHHRVHCEYLTYWQSEVKLELKQLQHISEGDIYGLCYAFQHTPFIKTKPIEWHIIREPHIIKVRNKTDHHIYEIDPQNGNVDLYYGNRHLIGKQFGSVQYLTRRMYAMPIFFHPKHWANNKTPHELGLATPNFGPLLNVLSVVYEKNQDLINEWLFTKKLEKVQLLNYKIFNEMLDNLCLENNLDLNKYL